MTQGPPAAHAARDRPDSPRFSTFSPSGLTSPDVDSEDRHNQFGFEGSSARPQVVPNLESDTEVPFELENSSHDREGSHEAHSSERPLLPPSIPALPLTIDSMPLTSALHSTLPPLPSTPSSNSPQPEPRMRRVSRRSPNARSERAAPSSIPTTDFSDLSSRLHQRRGSLSSRPSTRNRATSLSPPPAIPGQAEASTSQSRRHLDPDQHWLSEDEATGSVGGMSGARQRTSGRRRGVRRGFGSDDEGGDHARKARMDDILASRLGRSSHEIHHRPSKLAGVAPATAPVENQSDPSFFAVVVPRLLSLLTCPHCHELFNSPVTFGCGHTRCRACPVIDKSTPLIPQSPLVVSFTPSIPNVSTESALPLTKDRSNPVASFIPGTFPDPFTPAPSEPSTASTARTSTAAPSIPPCGVDNCRHAEFSPLPALFSSGPKTDYNLRKIVDYVRQAITDTTLASLILEPTHLETDKDHKTQLTTPASHGGDKSVPRMPSDSSGSSGGGEEVTKGIDDAKRAHKHKSGYKPVKVAKKTRRISESAIADEEEEDSIEPKTNAPESAQGSVANLASSFFGDVQAECECQVCVQLLSGPITSPCGHSFCRNCLARAYDHSSKCPLCRSDLPPLPYFNRERTNVALQSVIETAFPTLAAERAASIREEELAHLANVAIFICTTAWPGIPTFLHIFEPRYRLMMRRALESPTREFGMVLPTRDGRGGVNEYGTMLRITNCNVMEDGRSIVHCVGTWRFKIVERWMIDGYNVGRVERVDDVSLEQELELEQTALRSNHDELSEYRDPDPPGLQQSLNSAPTRPPMTGNMELAIDQLMQICLDFVQTLKAQSAPWVLQRLNNTVGEMPTTPAEFTWWCGEVMPVEDHVKVALLSITSVRERLRLIVFWIEQFRSSWWYSRGCNIM